MQRADLGARQLKQCGSLTILTYHSIPPEPDQMVPGGIHAELFGRQLDIIKRFFNVLPLSEAIMRADNGTLPARTVCITFDDGYADNFTVALPMLKERNLRATFFVTTGFLDGGIMWNDVVRLCVQQASSLAAFKPYLPSGALSSATPARSDVIDAVQRHLKYEAPEKRQASVDALAAELRTSIPSDVMMSSVQVKSMAAEGMDIGAHTVTHPILSRVEPVQARKEITGSKLALEEILGRSVDLFAYPNGVPGTDFTEEHLRMACEAGYSAAVTTSPGIAASGIDRMQLPRYAPWSTSTGRFMYNHWRNSRKTPTLLVA